MDESAICRFLRRNNFTRKKLSKPQRNITLRQQFNIDMSIYDPEMLLYITAKTNVSF